MGARPQIVIVSACTPDAKGTGWEQRCFSFILAYSKFADVRLWFVPTFDNPDLLRLAGLKGLCRSAAVLNFGSAAQARAAFDEQLAGADFVHVFRHPVWASVLTHKRIFFDIDEMPVSLRDNSRNRVQVRAAEGNKSQVFQLYKRACDNSVAVFVCSPLEHAPGITVTHVVPNIYPAGDGRRSPAPARGFLFVGNLGFMPNIDAATFFVRQVLPLLPADVRFKVIGRGPNDPKLRAEVDALARQDRRVEVVLDPEDVTPHYFDAAAAVVPLRAGSGTRIKILEAFAHGCPVVSTEVGCEGMEVKDSEHLLIRDEPEAFAAACLHILNEPGVARRLAATAAELLAAKYSQRAVDDVLRRVVEERPLAAQ